MIKVRLKAEQCALEGFQPFCLVVLESLLPPPSGESARQFIINPSCGEQPKMTIIIGISYFASVSLWYVKTYTLGSLQAKYD